MRERRNGMADAVGVHERRARADRNFLHVAIRELTYVHAGIRTQRRNVLSARRRERREHGYPMLRIGFMVVRRRDVIENYRIQRVVCQIPRR